MDFLCKMSFSSVEVPHFNTRDSGRRRKCSPSPGHLQANRMAAGVLAGSSVLLDVAAVIILNVCDILMTGLHQASPGKWKEEIALNLEGIYSTVGPFQGGGLISKSPHPQIQDLADPRTHVFTRKI